MITLARCRGPAERKGMRRLAPLTIAVACTAFLAACGASSNSTTSALSGGGASSTLGVAQSGATEKPAAAGASALAPGATLAARETADATGATRLVKTAAPASGAATTADPAVAKAIESITNAAKPGSSAYKIGPQDLVEISVFKVAELSKSVQVSENGTINLPLLGEVRAVGMTARDLERQLTADLGAKYLQNPQVTVYIREYNSQRVTLEGGGIKKPGVYALKGKMTLLQLVATAEGLSDISDSEVAIFRQKGEKKEAVKFNVASIRSGDSEDPELYAGDVVVAGTSATKEVFNNVLKAVPIAAAVRPF